MQQIPFPQSTSLSDNSPFPSPLPAVPLRSIPYNVGQIVAVLVVVLLVLVAVVFVIVAVVSVTCAPPPFPSKIPSYVPSTQKRNPADRGDWNISALTCDASGLTGNRAGCWQLTGRDGEGPVTGEFRVNFRESDWTPWLPHDVDAGEKRRFWSGVASRLPCMSRKAEIYIGHID